MADPGSCMAVVTASMPGCFSSSERKSPKRRVTSIGCDCMTSTAGSRPPTCELRIRPTCREMHTLTIVTKRTMAYCPISMYLTPDSATPPPRGSARMLRNRVDDIRATTGTTETPTTIATNAALIPATTPIGTAPAHRAATTCANPHPTATATPPTTPAIIISSMSTRRDEAPFSLSSW